jgi:hypothetical protein
MALSLGLIIYNATLLDFDHLLGEDGSVAVIGILAGFCAILMLGILLISKKIAMKIKK